MESFNVGTGSGIPPPRDFFSNYVLEHISGNDQDIFTKFYVRGEWGLAGMEWFMYTRLRYPIWRTATILN